MEDEVGIELGYLEECESWKLQSRFFPSKVGGKPAWGNLDFIPGAEQLQCRKCKETSIFLLQLYAPYDESTHIPLDRTVRNFHRSLFVFLCKNAQCCVRNNGDNIKVFRSSLPRSNKFYPYNAPEDKPDPLFSMENWTKLCRLCGCFASKKCSKCRVAYYCSRQHQVFDWKLHKTECGSIFSERLSHLLFPEWEIITEVEELDLQSNEKDQLYDVEKLKVADVGSLANVSADELSKYADFEEDKVFRKFQKRVEHNPDQIIRYQRGGNPLWIAKKPLPETIPDCEHCGGPRGFEFQVMPQLLTFLHENTLDWGILVVYTCEASCDLDGKYKEEFVFKQDVEYSRMAHNLPREWSEKPVAVVRPSRSREASVAQRRRRQQQPQQDNVSRSGITSQRHNQYSQNRVLENYTPQLASVRQDNVVTEDNWGDLDSGSTTSETYKPQLAPVRQNYVASNENWDNDNYGTYVPNLNRNRVTENYIPQLASVRQDNAVTEDNWGSTTASETYIPQLAPIRQNHVESDENWDNDNYGTYVPNSNRNIIREQPPNLSRRQKLQWRLSERQRLSRFQN